MEKYIRYTGSEPFIHCTCSECEKTDVSIKHIPQPLSLPEHLLKAIEVLLWYSPNVRGSYQSETNNYLMDSIYNDAVINYFLKYMDMEASDICFVADTEHSNEMVSLYLEKICGKCKKIIVAKDSHESKLTCVLRHMRNCIAHGRFNMLEGGRIIGYDKSLKTGRYTAVFLLDILTLNQFCIQLLGFPDFTISHIFQYAFCHFIDRRIMVVTNMTGGYNFRNNRLNEELVFIKDGNTKYRVNCSRYKNAFNSFERIDEYVFQDDEDFGQDAKFVDLFFCETETDRVRLIEKDKYIVNKEFLIDMLHGQNAAELLGIETNI